MEIIPPGVHDRGAPESRDLWLRSETQRPSASSVGSVPRMTRAELAALVDHTLLKPETVSAGFVDICIEATELGCASACVTSNRVGECAGSEGVGVPICAVIGFPSGAVLSQAKAAEAAGAVAEGATEIDMVADIGAIRDADFARMASDVQAVRDAIPSEAILKVILETATLSTREIEESARHAEASGANFVKTSTGFHPAGGASIEAVATLRRSVSDGTGVKASGGIRSLESALSMLDAGATRLGLSATRLILSELNE